MHQINNSSMSANKNINVANINTKKGNTDSHNSPGFKPAFINGIKNEVRSKK